MAHLIELLELLLMGIAAVAVHHLPPTSFWRTPKGMSLLGGLFLSGFIGWKFYQDYQDEKKIELTKWDFAVDEENKTGSVEGYCTYLAEYPTGEYAGQAQIKCHPAAPPAAESAPVADAPAADAATPADAAVPAAAAPAASVDPNCEGDCVNGYGTYKYSDGRVSTSYWKNGEREGEGTTILPDGNKYVGEFKDGQYNGQGTYFVANGDKYIGEFKDGVRNGQGTYFHANGNIALSILSDIIIQ